MAKKKVTDRQLAHGLSERSSGIRVQGYLNSGMLTETVGDEDGVGGGLEKGWHGMAWEGWVGRVSTMIHEI